MADTSIVSRAELEAIASVSGFAIWELEQEVSDSNFRFLRDELRAGRLGPIFSPGQALPPPSPIGQAVQAAVESEFVQNIEEALDISLPTLKALGINTIVIAVAVGIVALVILRG